MERIEKKYLIGLLVDGWNNEEDYITLTSNECHELLRHLGYFGEENKD